MDILFTALEFAPYVRTTPAADAIASLAKALKTLGHEVSVVVPDREDYQAAGLVAARRLSPLKLSGGGEARVSDAQLPSGVTLHLLSSADMDLSDFDPAAELNPKSARGLAIFSQAVAALCRKRTETEQGFDVVHAHDFGAGLGLVELRGKELAGLGTVLTVHDGSLSGRAAAPLQKELGLPKDQVTAHAFLSGEELSVLKGAIGLAGRVVTPSESYCKNLKAPELHGALARAFAGAEPLGIAEGVDLAVYNPATDAVLKTRFDAADPGPKGINKSHTCQELSIPVDPSRPLILLEAVSGGDSSLKTVLGALPSLVRLEVSLVVAGFGEMRPETREAVSALAPHVKWLDNTTDEERRRLLAAADFYLSAARHCPAGAAIRQATRYGATPIAFAADAVADTVIDADAALATGTGFLFDSMTQRALTGAVARAVSAYKKPEMAKLLRRVMRQDLAWDRPARRYLQVYQKAMHPRGD